MSCPVFSARAGDRFTVLIRYRLKNGADVPLTGLQARAEFRDAQRRTLLLLTEGAGLITAGAEGDNTIRVRASAVQTLDLAPSAGQPSHAVNLAVRVFDPADVANTTETMCDLTVVVSEQEVSLP